MLIESEIWIDINLTKYGGDDYTGYYRISNLQRVKRIIGNQCKKERILKPHINKRNRYRYLVLNKKGKSKACRMSRLIAIHFIPNPENKPCVCHKDNNRSNDNPNNLYWGTHSENIKQAYDDNRCEKTIIKARKHMRELGWSLSKTVYQYDINSNLINIFKSTVEAAKKTGISQPSISLYCNSNKMNRGFYWSYDFL